MTRVIHAMAGARRGGAEAFFERLVPALSRAGLEQRAVIRRDPDRTRRLRDQGVTSDELRFGGRLALPTRPAFRRAIRSFRPDVVVTWMSRASHLCPPGRFVHVGRLGGYYKLKYFQNCRHLIGNTEGLVAWLVAEGWPAERAHYLPNFPEAVPALPLARKDEATPADAPLLLALGRLHANKGFDVLLEALARLPEAWLWIAGTGPERDRLETQRARLELGDRVRFLGWRNDVPALLAAADILVCPSRHEPLGNVVLEGWAHRVPVVAAGATGPTELIRDGETGLLVPVEDTEALLAALGRVIAEQALREELIAAGRAAFEASFTEGAVVARYLEFFDRVVA